ncbi:hypothetical protein PAPYR_10874 [Paratrimastix pyriformis]|uniref:Uncharacterized protein n=1 Tax=Paratrimastix pyriformis TaxID=342808 RepID=A0ABQ8U4Y6_9EUKA|nr:hypothetical protein PAPYR_10874 [Paratrimastix pyriformis]
MTRRKNTIVVSESGPAQVLPPRISNQLIFPVRSEHPASAGAGGAATSTSTTAAPPCDAPEKPTYKDVSGPSTSPSPSGGSFASGPGMSNHPTATRREELGPDPLLGLELVEISEDEDEDAEMIHLFEDETDEEPQGSAAPATAPETGPAPQSTQQVTPSVDAAAPGGPPTLGPADSPCLLRLEALLDAQTQEITRQMQEATHQFQGLLMRMEAFETRVSRQMPCLLEVAAMPMLMGHLRQNLDGFCCSRPVRGRAFFLKDERDALLARAQALEREPGDHQAAAAELKARAQASLGRTPQLAALARKLGQSLEACEVDYMCHVDAQPSLHHPNAPPAAPDPSEGYCLAEWTLLSLSRRLKRLKGESILTHKVLQLERQARILRLRHYLRTGRDLTRPVRYALLMVRSRELSYAEARLPEVFAGHPGAFPHMEALLRDKCLGFLPVRVPDDVHDAPAPPALPTRS